MGKHKKLKPSQVGKSTLALADQIEAVKSKNRTKERNRHENDDEFVNADLTKKILRAARTQQAELDDSLAGSSSGKHLQLSASFEDTDSNDGGSILNDDDLELDTYCDTIEFNAEDDEIFKAFMSPNPQKIQTLADLVNENLSKKNTEVQSQFTDVGTLELENLEPRVKEMYELVGEILKKYRSGKIPAAFKMIPHLQNWALILSITQPQSWSAAAMYEATRIFASNMKEKMAQRFYNVVLLPRVRDDIHEYKRLNHYIYQALRKALFKPGAFMKGIVLPLLEAGDCTLQEAKIIGSVLARNSVPILHSSVVLLKIAEMEYTGANSMFMHILFDKKYALPYRVVDAVVCHFLRFATYPRPLPVLWHQTLLTFVQRYKADISTEQRDALLELLKKKTHSSITQEVRKELQAAQCRDIEVNERNQDCSMLVE